MEALLVNVARGDARTPKLRWSRTYSSHGGEEALKITSAGWAGARLKGSFGPSELDIKKNQPMNEFSQILAAELFCTLSLVFDGCGCAVLAGNKP